jgi:hypothetical protein
MGGAVGSSETLSADTGRAQMSAGGAPSFTVA